MSAEKVAVGENAASYTIEIDVADLATVMPAETPALAPEEQDMEQQSDSQTQTGSNEAQGE